MLSNINTPMHPDEFEPGAFSIQELRFLLEHLEEPPVVAFNEFEPEGKHRGVFRERAGVALQRFYEAEELRKARDIPWAGYDAIADSIARFLAFWDRTLEIRRRSRGRINNPSQYGWDDSGRPFLYATGSDSCEMVRTEIQEDGSRKRFAVRLVGDTNAVLSADLRELAPWIKGPTPEIRAERIIVNTKGDTGFYRCPVCEHTEEFDPASRQAQSLAHARMGRHLKRAKTSKNRHTILYTKEYR